MTYIDESSAKRFHRKGFKLHNKPYTKKLRPIRWRDDGLTNHERMKNAHVFWEKKKMLLRELIKQTKEAHPNEKRTYRQWTLLAIQETQAKLHED